MAAFRTSEESIAYQMIEASIMAYQMIEASIMAP